jgi:hypothetical protein
MIDIPTVHLLKTGGRNGVIGGIPGHHVMAKARRSRTLVKAVSPALRGRSGAESLDEGEASPRLIDVMAGQCGRAGVFTTRRRGSAHRGLMVAFEIGLVLAQQVREPPFGRDPIRWTGWLSRLVTV